MSSQFMKYFPAAIIIKFTFFCIASTIELPDTEELAIGQEILTSHLEDKGKVWCQIVCFESNVTAEGLYKAVEIKGLDELGPVHSLKCNCLPRLNLIKLLESCVSYLLCFNELMYVIPGNKRLLVLQVVKQKNTEKLILKGSVNLNSLSPVEAEWPVKCCGEAIYDKDNDECVSITVIPEETEIAESSKIRETMKVAETSRIRETTEVKEISEIKEID